MRRSAGGFTIVELLIVIVVIAILATISVVAYNGVRDRAQYTKALSDLTVINKAISTYKAQYDTYPVASAWRYYWGTKVIQVILFLVYLMLLPAYRQPLVRLVRILMIRGYISLIIQGINSCIFAPMFRVRFAASYRLKCAIRHHLIIAGHRPRLGDIGRAICSRRNRLDMEERAVEFLAEALYTEST